MKPTIVIAVVLLVMLSCAPCLQLTEFAYGRYVDLDPAIQSLLSWLQTGTLEAQQAAVDTATPYPTYTPLPTYTMYPTYTPPSDDKEKDTADKSDSGDEDDDSNTITIVANTSTPKAASTRIVVYPTLCPQYYLGTPCP